MATKVFLEWENVNFTWDNLDMLWEDVSILIDVEKVVRKGGGLGSYIRGNPWDQTRKELGEEKTKKFIRLVCRVNDLEYEDIIDPNPRIKVTAEHIEKTFNESIKVGVKIDLQK